MAIAEQDLVNIGQQPNDGSGDTARVAFSKINNMFKHLDSVIMSNSVGYTNLRDLMADQSKPIGTIAEVAETGERYIRSDNGWELVKSSILGSKNFATYQDMVDSNLNVNNYAIVINDDDPAKNGIYQKSDLGFIKQGYSDLSILFTVLNLLKNVLSDVHDDRGVRVDYAVVNAKLHSIIFGLAGEYLYAPNHLIDFSDNGFAITDAAGRCPFKINRDGSVYIANLVGYANQLHQQSEKQRQNLPYGWRKKDINHIVVYGQSLSDGSTSNKDEPLQGMEISKLQPYQNLMLAGGTRAEPQHSFYSSDFAPLVEASIGQISNKKDIRTYNPSQNESPTSSICNEFTRRCLERSQKSNASDFVMLGTSSGRGGLNVEALINGTQFEVLEKHIMDVVDTAIAKNKTSAVAAICYIQGEANHHAILRELNSFDESITADIFEYQNRVQSLIDKIDNVILNNKNQDFLPYVITYQTEAHRSYEINGKSLNVNPIATAQWFMSKSNDRVILAVPVYAIPKNNRDKVHTSHVGSWVMGAYFARAMEYTLHSKMGKWRPLEPIRYHWTDTHCDIEFHVPCGELVLDTYFCPQQPNQGFDIWVNGELQTNAIRSVELVDYKTVRVNFNGKQTNAQLSYCLGREDTKPNAFGNLRDSHGDTDQVIDPLGNTHKLHNPAIMFNIHQSRGFI
ncbi:hypothetical protein [Mannheimia indoligenes]|uniref:Sialate O-acetylesterase domain-containing protein n=1 Tax=Mannheimia indoligenes TaxID=3103145 RepID=A0ABU7ZE88_9PAST